jgi:hypothetical protein
MTITYLPIPDCETYWCNSHRRRARRFCVKMGEELNIEACCGPNQSGIMLPCFCVRLTGIAEVVES